ncbi:hypothetical protein K493DRAFT_313754 [Basidiobolus meristosporus CBS 931.73]|uniref:Uncharacterized protein n=1 Tax=Basidiobolus meristosporus CBS 931.73 TaxID=1314790 RepID=A0A1Y1YJM6_9FUNG|nr:hypothetical protein K493DRAFT_313754 [Basidiobolus meristosporus CBS 931.73]|eukprot:ORX98209.1 hypothetical protein K493DRAFT_313754 [Basidiobolus meristosporus CBS 931.73]
MFSIKHLVDSEADSRVPNKHLAFTSTVGADLAQTEARTRVLERADTMKYLRKLKSRLAYATFKVDRGWESRSFEEVKHLYQETRSSAEETSHNNVPSTRTTPATSEPEFVVPRTPVSVRHKRKQTEEPKSRPLTPRPTFSSSKNIQNHQNVKGRSGTSLGAKANQRSTKEPSSKLLNKSKVMVADKENQKPNPIGAFEWKYTTPPRSLSERTLCGQQPPCQPNFLASIGPNGTKTPLENVQRQSRSTSPAFEAAETIMMLSSPRPSTPITPRYSPLENSPPPGSGLEMQPLQQAYQDGDLFNSAKDPLNLLVATASYFPK